jgi:hypothetical protein
VVFLQVYYLLAYSTFYTLISISLAGKRLQNKEMMKLWTRQTCVHRYVSWRGIFENRKEGYEVNPLTMHVLLICYAQVLFSLRLC